ncbi:MAG: hypothetical protein OEY48_02895 [Gammaproteobacteria bacterium]|nr:hypothetical protein [Gammaproteobacteria bacterium]
MTRSLFFGLTLLLGACSGPLPKGTDTIKSPWDSFEQAKNSYDNIILRETTTSQLQELGFNPYKTPNVRILSYLDIIRKFSPNDSVKSEDLPPSVRTCLASREACLAYEATPGVYTSTRVGNVLLDLLNFKRKSIQTGWFFNALIVIHHDVVVYKIWSGTPIIDSEKTRNNPLGPIQEPVGSIMKDAAGI